MLSIIRPPIFLLVLFAATLSSLGYAEKLIVYTAHNEWDSRIYLLFQDGSQFYFEYPLSRFTDLEIVENEIYVSEAFAPRVYKVDKKTGRLELVIDDWSLIAFYGLFSDGKHLYLKEGQLYRYKLNGEFDSAAQFDEFIDGSAWDGEYFWTLNQKNGLRAWDLKKWPKISVLQRMGVKPPTSHCRGLWFDGESFWTAESTDKGSIYQFTPQGEILGRWPLPSGYGGWSAGTIDF